MKFKLFYALGSHIICFAQLPTVITDNQCSFVYDLLKLKQVFDTQRHLSYRNEASKLVVVIHLVIVTGSADIIIKCKVT